MTSGWQEVSIDVTGRGLSRINSGSVWVSASHGQPSAFLVNDSRWE